MNITILNGSNKENNFFNEYITSLKNHFGGMHPTKIFNLDEMKIDFCVGCWNCWWKNPGVCSLKDDAPLIFNAVINADFFLFASPLVAGFTSYQLKCITDRLIILLHPYIKIVHGECHHKKRYDRYPDFGLIYQEEKDTDNEDLEIIRDIYHRLSLNFHADFRFMHSISETSPTKIVHEACHI